jgi:hypothetical protein
MGYTWKPRWVGTKNSPEKLNVYQSEGYQVDKNECL